MSSTATTAPVRTAPWPKPPRRYGRAERKEVLEALAQDSLSYLSGGKTKQFCAAMAKHCGVPYALACSSGSAALHAALKALGVGPGDEVIVPPASDAGTYLGILYEGALPVFADIDPDTYNSSAANIAARITSRTRAVIVVHLAGNPSEVRRIVRLCRGRGIRVIEDCAQAWGARWGKRPVGTFGDIGCFSLNASKHISTGEGGLLVTRSRSLYRKSWLAVDKCYDRVKGTRPMHFVAPNYRITELQSAVGIPQLRKVAAITRKRNRLGQRLTNGLLGIDSIRPHLTLPGACSSYWFYLIGVNPERIPIGRFAEAMRAEGIPGRAGYNSPVYLTYRYLKQRTPFHHSNWPFRLARRGYALEKGLCPVAEKVLESVFVFGLHEGLSNQEIDDTIAAVKKVMATVGLRRIGPGFGEKSGSASRNSR